jgi:hypothetical protein
MNPVKKIAHLTKMCTLTGACLSGRLLYLRSHGEGRYVVPLKHLPYGEFQERWKEELAGREESKGRFTLWTMKSSHGRLSDVIGR